MFEKKKIEHLVVKTQRWKTQYDELIVHLSMASKISVRTLFTLTQF